MTSKRLGALALGAAAVAVATYLATGTIPDAPPGGVCLVSQARGPCAAANALSATGAEFQCADPTQPVYGYAEIVADPDGGHDADLPHDLGFIELEDSTREVDCSTFARPSKALTIRRTRPGMGCLVGPWITDAGAWDGRTSTAKTCDPGARCKAGATCEEVSPLVHAGLDTTEEILCRVLGDAGCEAAREKQRVSELPWCEQSPDNCRLPGGPERL